MEVKLPDMGEGIEEASVSFWYKKAGDTVQENEDLVELTTEKTSFNLPILFLTQLMGLALGIDHRELGLPSNIVPASKVLARYL